MEKEKTVYYRLIFGKDKHTRIKCYFAPEYPERGEYFYFNRLRFKIEPPDAQESPTQAVKIALHDLTTKKLNAWAQVGIVYPNEDGTRSLVPLGQDRKYCSFLIGSDTYNATRANKPKTAGQDNPLGGARCEPKA